MAKQKRKETQKEQSERFRKAAQNMIDAGELSPTEGKDSLNKLVRASANKGSSPGEKMSRDFASREEKVVHDIFAYMLGNQNIFVPSFYGTKSKEPADVAWMANSLCHFNVHDYQ